MQEARTFQVEHWRSGSGAVTEIFTGEEVSEVIRMIEAHNPYVNFHSISRIANGTVVVQSVYDKISAALSHEFRDEPEILDRIADAL